MSFLRRFLARQLRRLANFIEPTTFWEDLEFGNLFLYDGKVWTDADGQEIK